MKDLVPGELCRLRSYMMHKRKSEDDQLDGFGPKDFFLRAFQAIAVSGIEGNDAEFGCSSGQFFGMSYQARRSAGFKGKMWAFDSFQRLPATAGPIDEHPVWIEGDISISLEDFPQKIKSSGIREDEYQTMKRFHKQSLSDVDPERPDRSSEIAIAYIGCDLNNLTMDVLMFLDPRLRHGMILDFGAYYWWSQPAVSGERAVSHEVFSGHPKCCLSPYIPIGWPVMSLIVQERGLPANVVERAN